MYSFSLPAKRVVKRIAWIGAWVTLLVGGPAFGQSPPAGMVEVSAGAFIYGPPEAEENKNLPAFYIDTYEVTAGDYKACVEAGGCSYNGGDGNDHTYNNGKDNHPINLVNWGEADTYCKWKGKRLPTEVEWEKAARGTDGRTYPWGNQAVTCSYAIWNQLGGANGGCGTGSTWEVGQKPSGVSPYGVHDMAGSITEWTGSWKSTSQNERVMRGGSWGDWSVHYL